MAKKNAAPTKSQIVAAVAAKADLSKKQVNAVLEALGDQIKKSLKGIQGSVSIGTRALAIPWAVHVYCVGNGKSEVAVRVGEMRTAFGRFVFLKEAYRIVDSLGPHLTGEAAQPQQPQAETYGPVYEAVCASNAT